MVRPALFLVLASLIGLNAAADESMLITNWINYATSDAAGATPAITDATITLSGADKKGSCMWAVFDPVTLTSGRPVTLSCKVALPADYPKHATAQMRIGIYGVVAGTSPTTTRQADLCGFILNAGAAGKQWHLELSEHATAGTPLIFMAGMTNRAAAVAEATGGRGSGARVVLTLTRKSPDLISCSGFWGDMPYSFEIKPLAGDYTHLRAIAFMRGGTSGTGAMSFSNVKIRPE